MNPDRPIPPRPGRAGVYIDHVLTPGAGPDEVRAAVRAGRLVVAVDDAGIAIQITKEILARVDRRKKHFPCITSQKLKTP